jgi:hypothetical protein
MRVLALTLALTSTTLAPSAASASDVKWCILTTYGIVTFCYPTLEQCTLYADQSADERCIERPA